MGSNVELLEGKDATQSRVCVQSEYEYCRQCLHLEDSLKAAQNRCAALELEIEGKKNEVKLLQKLLELEGEKIAVENELQLLKRKSKELEALETHNKSVTNNVLGEGLKTMGGVDEKDCKSTMYLNARGFSQCDAYRGSELAQFLTDGNPKGDVVKSVKELQEHDPKGLEKCGSLARRYSKQLFEIYRNKEDPLFLPSSLAS